MYLGLFIDRNETNWASLHNGGNISKTSFCRLSTLSLTMTDALGAIHKRRWNISGGGWVSNFNVAI